MKKIKYLSVAAMAMFFSLTACAGDLVPDGYMNIQTEQPYIDGCPNCHETAKADQMKQREKPGISKTQLESTLGVTPSDKNYVSGGQFENFKTGWATAIFSNGKRSHYFNRVGFDGAKSLCNVTSQVRWIYGAGNYPKCKRCQSMINNTSV